MAEPSFPETLRTCVPRLSRWEFLLTEMGKPHRERAGEVREIVQANTAFDLRFVTNGRKLDDGTLQVTSCDALGLAALDPVFHKWRLRPSVILPECNLDLGGVEIPTIKDPRKFVRVSYLSHHLPAFFGIRSDDWRTLTDIEWHRRHRKTTTITPDMILDLLDIAIRRKYGKPLSELRRQIATEGDAEVNSADRS